MKAYAYCARKLLTRDLDSEIARLRVELHITQQALKYVSVAVGKPHDENVKRLLKDPHAELEETIF